MLIYYRGFPCIQRRSLTGTSTRLEVPGEILKHTKWIEPSLYSTNKHDYSYLWMLPIGSMFAVSVPDFNRELLGTTSSPFCFWAKIRCLVWIALYIWIENKAMEDFKGQWKKRVISFHRFSLWGIRPFNY